MADRGGSDDAGAEEAEVIHYAVVSSHAITDIVCLPLLGEKTRSYKS